MELLRELAGTTAEIDNPPAGARLHEGREIPKRLGAFGPEALVLIRVPLLRVRACHAVHSAVPWNHAAMSILPDSGRAAERLDREVIGWLTTVRASGRPQTSPVWFVVHDDAVYIQSQPHAAKLSNIRANGKVSFHLDSDGAGGDIVTIDADA